MKIDSAHSAAGKPQAKRAAARIAIIYAVIGAVWVVFSDVLLARFARDLVPFVKVGMLKAWLFVLVTAFVLYWLSYKNFLTIHAKEGKLRESESLYQTIFENTGTATVIVDDDMTILLANSEFERITGYSKVQIEGKKKWSDFLPDSHVQQAKRFHTLRREQPQSVPKHYETQIIDKTGQARDVYLTVELIPESSRSIASILDITERRKNEESIQRAASIVESSDDAIIGETLDGAIVSWNRGAERIYGYTAEEVLGRNITMLMPPDRPNESAELMALLMSGERIDHFETVRMRKDGELIHASLTISAIEDRTGNMVGASTIARDITERKRAEERAHLQQQQLMQADKMATLGILVSGVAHEINNPNNFIMLNAKIIRRVWDDIAPILQQYYDNHGDFSLAGMPYTRAHEKISQLITGVSDGSKRIQRIVQSLKDYARRDTDEPNQTVDINQVVESAGIILENLIKKSTDNFSVHYGENLPKIRGNHQHLEQVVINLITNACQALEHKKQAVSVETRYDKDDARIVLDVRDQGSGISQADLKHIMDPFFTTKRGLGGTGLGLSISERIIREHGGDIIVDSEPGKGTVVTITLPVCSDSEEGSR